MLSTLPILRENIAVILLFSAGIHSAGPGQLLVFPRLGRIIMRIPLIFIAFTTTLMHLQDYAMPGCVHLTM